jgi:hypothetical protein
MIQRQFLHLYPTIGFDRDVFLSIVETKWLGIIDRDSKFRFKSRLSVVTSFRNTTQCTEDACEESADLSDFVASLGHT